VTVLDEGRSAIGEITSKVLAKEEKEARSIDWWGMITGMKDGKWRKRTIGGVRGFVSLFPFD
jgi:hypothetical protein